VGRKKRKSERKKQTVRIPNPDAPVRERLDTPSHRVHRTKKGYQRRPKHPRPLDE
jgi:hypothetical protein